MKPQILKFALSLVESKRLDQIIDETTGSNAEVEDGVVTVHFRASPKN